MTTLGHHPSVLSSRRTVPAGAVLLLGVLVLAGCGDSTSAQDPTASSPAASSPTASSPAASSPAASSPAASSAPATGGSDQVRIVSATAAGGTVDLSATPLSDEAAVQAFARQFRATALPDQISSAVAATTVPEGSTLWAAVVAVGCDVPPGASVSSDGAGVVLSPQKVASPLPECLAAVTSVALAVVAD